MFNPFKLAVQKQFNEMKKTQLFRMNVSKDLLWETYLNSFPEGTNPVYKERTEHDCNCCKSFIRNAGNMAAIVDGKIVTIWDIKIDNFYQAVADKMAELVRSATIDNVFLSTEDHAGTDKQYQNIDGVVQTWTHFHLSFPHNLVAAGASIGSELGECRATKDVMLRSLTELKLEAVDTVLELIDQNSLYRGEEHKFAVESFRKLLVAFNKLPSDDKERDIFCWSQFKSVPASVTRMRNTVIGTLLSDLSEGYELEDCIKSFEQKVAPANYKRPTAIVTKAMIEKAKQTIQDLGYMTALDRRFATIGDVSVNNVLFADRTVKPLMDASVFDTLVSSVPTTTKHLDKIEEVSIEDFIGKILPKVSSIEVLFENQHTSNLVSLIAPSDLTAKSMFKWPNQFSWSYTGEMADSIKERVKAAGGSIVGDLCCRLAWEYEDDLDFHMHEPAGGDHIYFSNKRCKSRCGGILDVDANGSDGRKEHPVENIYYAKKSEMKEGIYSLKVNNYSRRSDGIGFIAEIEFDGTIHTFEYNKVIRDSDTLTIAEISYSKKEGFKIVKSIPSTAAVKTVWNIPTNTYHKVSVMMLSPNHWDDKSVGNKHYFFMLDGCKTDDKARGFFNEFLSAELDPHRKVLEMVGAKMRTDNSDNQLSGLGFSSTQRNVLLCRVKGSFTRTIKIIF